MPRPAIVATILLAACAGWSMPGRARDEPPGEPGAERPVTAERLLEVAREAYRPAGLRRACEPGAAGEIVVCAPAFGETQRLTSPTDEAIAAGVAVRDHVLRAPDLAPPPCDPRSLGCFKFGAPPPMPPMIDLSAIPEALTPEEAALVFRAGGQASSEAASPAGVR